MRFTSKSPTLILQDDDGVWAEFADHVFETDDKALIKRLSGIDGVSQADDAAPSEQPAPDDAGDDATPNAK